MNISLRSSARTKNLSLLEYILNENKRIGKETHINRTIFAACPNSVTVMKAALNSAKRCNAPIKFATTLNQVDLDGGYTGFTPKQFVAKITPASKKNNFQKKGEEDVIDVEIIDEHNTN